MCYRLTVVRRRRDVIAACKERRRSLQWFSVDDAVLTDHFDPSVAEEDEEMEEDGRRV